MPRIRIYQLARELKLKSKELIEELKGIGVEAKGPMGTIDEEKASILRERLRPKEEKPPILRERLRPKEEKPSKLHPRAPVVTVMGHVDHGKTTLLDAIRKTNVAEKEAGGLTQHIGASEVNLEKGRIIFLDTPGHEAFTRMRARGAQATDLVVLVVAADDGVMLQTVEAIDHARAAKVPIVVAINKIDLPNVNPEKVKRQLVEKGLVPEDKGGKTVFVEVSALKGEGIDELLEMILLEAEMLELKADPTLPAKGIIIESKLDRRRGQVATILVKDGTLRVGDPFVGGDVGGKVKLMLNDKGKALREAGPSQPVEALGFSGLPEAGDEFEVVEDERKAREISLERQLKRKGEVKPEARPQSLQELSSQIKKGKAKELNVILKGDVHGSVEALGDSLEKLPSEEVGLRIIHRGVGEINESDVMLASASQAIIIGFHVGLELRAEEMAKREKIDFRLYDVIYEAISDLKAALEGLFEPKFEEVLSGRAEIRKVFQVSKIGKVAGCYILEGKVERGSKARVVREGERIFEGSVKTLKRFKDDVKEVETGYECGIGLDFDGIKEGDTIELYRVEEVRRP